MNSCRNKLSDYSHQLAFGDPSCFTALTLGRMSLNLCLDSFLFFLKTFFFFNGYGCLASMYSCVAHAYMQSLQKGALYPLVELELQSAANSRLGTWN